MNKTYRVIFSKARGALMVANEITSSIQKKGTATMVAAAVMGVMSATAVAQTGTNPPQESLTWDKVLSDYSETKVIEGFVGKEGTETGAVSDTSGSGSLLDGYTFRNNVSQGKGGALVLGNNTDSGYAVQNTTFINNSAAGWGGAIRLLKASLKVTATEATVSGKATPQNIVSYGNRAGTKQDNSAQSGSMPNDMGNWFEDMGGFTHLQGDSTLTLEAKSGSSITIGQAGAYNEAGLDSITSSNGKNTINVNVEDNSTVTLNGSLKGYVGKIAVSGAGTLVMATGFGETDNNFQASVNSQTDLSKASSSIEASTLTVGSGGEQSGPTVYMGDLNITRSVSGSTEPSTPSAGTILDVQSGELIVSNIHVGSKSYHDLMMSESGQFVSGSVSTTGIGEAKIGTYGALDVTGSLTVDSGSSFTISSGSMHVGAVNVASGGSVGISSGANLYVTGTGGVSTNAGTLGTLKSGGMIVAASTPDGSAVLNNTGLMQGNSLSISSGGVVNTSLDKTHYLFLSTTLNEGGVLNATEGNSVKADILVSTMKDGGDPKNPAVFNLNGGRLLWNGAEFTGTVKVGSSYGTGKLTIDNGSYTLAQIYVGSHNTLAKEESTKTYKSSVTIGKNGELTLGELNLEVGNQTTITNNGSITLGKVVLPSDGKIREGITINNEAGASITSTIDTFAKVTESGGSITEVTTSAFGDKLKGQSGMMYATDSITLTKTEFEQFNSAFTSGNFVLVNATITGDTNGAGLTWDDVSGGFVSPNTSVSVTAGSDGTATISGGTSGKDVVVKNIDTGTSKTVAVQSSGGVTIAGDGGTVFGGAVETVKVTSGAALTLGYEGREASGTLQANVDVQSGSLTVAAGDFKAANGISVTGTTSGALNVTGGNLTVSKGVSLGNSGTVSVAGGNLTVDHFDSTQSGSITLGSNGVLGVQSSVTTPATTTYGIASTLANEVDTGAGTLVWSKAVTINADTQGAMLGLGATAAQTQAAVENALGDKATTYNTYYLGKQVELKTTSSTLTLGKGYALVVNMGGVANTEGYDAASGALIGNLKVDSGQGSTNGTGTLIVLQNLDGKALKITPANGDTGAKRELVLANGSSSSLNGATVDYGTIFYGDTITAVENADGTVVSYTGQSTLNGSTTGTNGTISFATNAQAMKALDAMHLDMGSMVKQAIENVDLGNNALVDQIVYGTGAFLAQAQADAKAAGVTDVNAYVAQKLAEYGANANAVSNIAVTGGAFSVAMDVQREINNATQQRTSLLTNVSHNVATTPWIAMMGAKNKAEKLYGNGFGYESSVYGVTLGADTVVNGGSVVGLQFSAGSGDSNSLGTTQRVDNDFNFWGVKAYAAQQIGAFNSVFDVSYSAISNDLSTTGASNVYTESLNAAVMSVGANVEYAVKFAAFDFVPHVGVRYSRLSMDNTSVANYDTMNIFQVPVGVGVTTQVKVGDNWQLAPMADLSVVPTLGDRDAVANFGTATSEVRVLDTSPVQFKLGLTAGTDAFEVGASYGLNAGGDSRLDNTFNVNMRFSF